MMLVENNSTLDFKSKSNYTAFDKKNRSTTINTRLG
jgi:hypothetical protein